MSFLEDLKRQADALREQQGTEASDLQRNTELVEDVCKGTLNYFVTLVEQLGVLQPESHARFELDRRHAFDGLRLTDFYVDSRRRRLGNNEVFDLLVLHWQAKTGQKLVISKDFLGDMQRLEARLRQGGVAVDIEPVRNPENSRLQEMRYTFVADFRGSVRVTPRHELGLLQFQLQNLEALEMITFDLSAEEITETRLDELARWLVGHPHQFLRDVRNLRRVES